MNVGEKPGGRDEAGVAFVTVLVLITLLGVIVGAYALMSGMHVSTGESLARSRQAGAVAEAGLEAWAAQVRADALLRNVGVIPTELMSLYPGTPIRINELKTNTNEPACGLAADQFGGEIINTSESPIRIGGWYFAIDNSVTPQVPAGTVLAPGQFFTINGAMNISGQGPERTFLCNPHVASSGEDAVCDAGGNTGGVVDSLRFHRAAAAPDTYTWQVYPDGHNGIKPAAQRDAFLYPQPGASGGGNLPSLEDQPSWGWQYAGCTLDPDNDPTNNDNTETPDRSAGSPGVGPANGSGLWIKAGVGDKSGILVIQRDDDGNEVVRLDFATDVDDNAITCDFPTGPPASEYREANWRCRRKYKDRLFLDASDSAYQLDSTGGTAALVLTPTLDETDLRDFYPDGRSDVLPDNRDLGFGSGVDVPEFQFPDEALVVPTQRFADMTFPKFDRTTMAIELLVPRPRVQPLPADKDTTIPGSNLLPWNRYRYGDENVHPSDAVPEMPPFSAATGSGEWGWLVRVDTGTTTSDLRRAAKDVAEPDPGTTRPDRYLNDPSQYAFNNASRRDGRLYVSELYDTRTLSDTTATGCQLKITTVQSDNRNNGEPNYLEVYNPGPDPYTLNQLEEQDYMEQPGFFGGWDTEQDSVDDIALTLQPGENFVASDDQSVADLGDHGMLVDWIGNANGPDNDDGNKSFRIRDDSDTICDALGVRQDNDAPIPPDWREREAADNVFFDRFHLRRQQQSDGMPQDTDHNENDFTTELLDNDPPDPEAEIGDLPPPERDAVELLLFGSPKRRPPDKYEFVELFNTTNGPVDGTTLSISDTLDTDGRELATPRSYDLAVHPMDPIGSGDATIDSGQVALVFRHPTEVSGGFDTEAIGFRDSGIADFLDGSANNGDTVRVFHLTRNGNPQFLTGGLYDKEMEDVIVSGGPQGSHRVLASGETWSPQAVTGRESREKVVIDGANRAENWRQSRPRGTPGEVPLMDHFDEPWGWGGTLLPPDVHMGKRIYVPSMESSRQDGDIGYFEMVRIEDESGKNNLLNPAAQANRDTTSLEGAGTADRTFTRTQAENVLPFVRGEPDHLITVAGILGADDVGPAGLEDYRRVYSGYRTGADSERINLNTAPYEALRSIQVNPLGSTPLFMTEAMAEAIIARRSCSSISNPPHRIPRENYDPGCTSNRPFIGVLDACGYLNDEDPGSVTNDVTCNILRRFAKTTSDGLVRGRVRGVTLDDGDSVSAVCREIVVDRRDLETRSGPMVTALRRRCP